MPSRCHKNNPASLQLKHEWINEMVALFIAMNHEKITKKEWKSKETY